MYHLKNQNSQNNTPVLLPCRKTMDIICVNYDVHYSITPQHSHTQIHTYITSTWTAPLRGVEDQRHHARKHTHQHIYNAPLSSHHSYHTRNLHIPFGHPMFHPCFSNGSPMLHFHVSPMFHFDVSPMYHSHIHV